MSLSADDIRFRPPGDPVAAVRAPLSAVRLEAAPALDADSITTDRGVAMNYTQAQAQTQTVYVRNDNVLSVTGLRKLDGTYDNAATVTVTVTTRAGVEVAGQDMPVALAYVEGSDGDYSCTLQKELEWELNEPYLAEVTAVSDGLTAVWTLRLTARLRSFAN